jgi:uncharacterized OsmC-like protein
MTLVVSHVEGEIYDVHTRGHSVRVDQPTASGGTDTALTPTELFVGSLASCVAFYAGRYLDRHGLSRDGLQVSAEYDMEHERLARVTAIHVTIQVPDDFPIERRPALRAVASHCTVHNSLSDLPVVTVDLAD